MMAGLPMVGLQPISSTAWAQDVDSDSDRVVFVLHESSPAASVLRIFDGLQGQLGELELDIDAVHLARPEKLDGQARQAAEVAGQRGANAVFWFASRGRNVRVYALHVPSGRVFARDLELSGDSTLKCEKLAVVLRAAIPAVLQGEPELGEPLLVVGPEPDGAEPEPEASAVARAQESFSARDTRPHLRLAIEYSGALVAENAWQSGVLGEVMVDVEGWVRAGLSAGYSAPTTLDGAEADAAVSGVPIAARIGVWHRIGWATVGLEAGALAEAWHRRSIVRADTLEPTAPSTTWRLGGTLGARFEVPISSMVVLFVLGEAQWLPSPHTLSVKSEQGVQRLPTHELRPRLALGTTFNLHPRDKMVAKRKNPTPRGQPGHL
jgi:hypothetical protein